MIDKNYHSKGSKGFGDKPKELLLDKIKEDKSHNKIFLGVHKECYAVNMYKKFDFEVNGQVFGTEHIMRLNY